MKSKSLKTKSNYLKPYDLHCRITKQEMDNQEKEIKQAIQKAMEEHGIKSFENEDVKISYVAPTQRVSVDTAKMKEEGIYDLYTKTSEVKASVRFTFK